MAVYANWKINTNTYNKKIKKIVVLPIMEYNIQGTIVGLVKWCAGGQQ